jgi:hypothetical protein
MLAATLDEIMAHWSCSERRIQGPLDRFPFGRSDPHHEVFEVTVFSSQHHDPRIRGGVLDDTINQKLDQGSGTLQ